MHIIMKIKVTKEKKSDKNWKIEGKEGNSMVRHVT